jgi:hypothetical protein
MSETIPLERMRPDEIARLKIRYTNRDGSAEVLCSKAWAHIQLQDATIASLRAEVARKDAALKMARAHVATNAQGWSVSRREAMDDLAKIDAALNPSQEPRT